MPRFIKVTSLDGVAIWLNIALVTYIRPGDEGNGSLVYFQADDYVLRVKEPPEHLVQMWK